MRLKKENVSRFYFESNVVIVPYKKILLLVQLVLLKIVEAIFHNIPVVSVPLNGYEEFSYLKFANNKEDFIYAIDSYMNRSVNS